MDDVGLMKRSGGVLTCSHCSVVAHPECIKRAHSDLPQGKDSWTCWDCARNIGSVMHNSSCDECNEGENIIRDIGLGIDLLASLEAVETQHLGSSSNSSSASMDIPAMKVRHSVWLLCHHHFYHHFHRHHHRHYHHTTTTTTTTATITTTATAFRSRSCRRS